MLKTFKAQQNGLFTLGVELILSSGGKNGQNMASPYAERKKEIQFLESS
jgi:hypothetical protein